MVERLSLFHPVVRHSHSESGAPETVRFNEALALFQRMPRSKVVDVELKHDSKWYKKAIMFANKFQPMPSVTKLTLTFTSFAEVVALLNLMPALQVLDLTTSNSTVAVSSQAPTTLHFLRDLTVLGPKTLELSLLDFLTPKTLEGIEKLRVDRLSWIISPRTVIALAVSLVDLTIQPRYYVEGNVVSRLFTLADLIVFRKLTRLLLEISVATSDCTIETVLASLSANVTTLELCVVVRSTSVLACSKSIIRQSALQQLELTLYVPQQASEAAQKQLSAHFIDMLAQLGRTFVGAGIVMTHTIRVME